MALVMSALDNAGNASTFGYAPGLFWALQTSDSTDAQLSWEVGNTHRDSATDTVLYAANYATGSIRTNTGDSVQVDLSPADSERDQEFSISAQGYLTVTDRFQDTLPGSYWSVDTSLSHVTESEFAMVLTRTETRILDLSAGKELTATVAALRDQRVLASSSNSTQLARHDTGCARNGK